ncbi:MAG: hypothetical protein E7543_02355 [Ruminococcaceae bacterium]|nr:hypothetical protein [Oscillospiraceae bacterium]
MQQLMNKIEGLIAEYETALSEKGLACSLSKKYFETKVPHVPHHSSYTLLDDIHRHFAKRRENRHFRHQRNRQHCAVLCFRPADKTLLKKEECKEYAFILSEISRYEEGMKPRKRTLNEKTVLRRIEKCICRILKSAEKKDPVRICQCSVADYIRYFSKKEYGYMKVINGRDRDFLDLMLSAVVLGVIGLTALVLCI